MGGFIDNSLPLTLNVSPSVGVTTEELMVNSSDFHAVISVHDVGVDVVGSSVPSGVSFSIWYVNLRIPA